MQLGTIMVKIEMLIKTYHDLIRIPSFEDRFQYLKLCGCVGDSTFGYARYLNQNFYRSKEWKRVRNEIIVRDNACDLAHEDHPIMGYVIVHHINPISIEDMESGSSVLLDPENLICVSDLTHRAITYGSEDLLPKKLVERVPYDTCPWRQ